ncbi:MAG: 16S rRNA (adenine(1518)-N(6)/adenine(1519)-N(6)) -dimethyltransferase RsmA [Patescibacteria group bacterium]
MPQNAVQAKKKFGQNFLVSKFHLELLESELRLFIQKTSPAKILEIGPGAAALTRIILNNFSGQVEAWEIDPEAVDYLSQNLVNQNFHLFQRDALKFLEEVLKGESEFTSQAEEYVLVSNLPYNVGSRILVDITQLKFKPNGFLVMLQKEVGEKLILKEKNTNLLGTFLNLFWDIKLVAKFPRSAFSPQPNVESVLVRATLKQANHSLDATKALFLLKNLLKYPNKTIANNLTNLGWESKKIHDFMLKFSLEKNIRLTNLNYEQILVLIQQYED